MHESLIGRVRNNNTGLFSLLKAFIVVVVFNHSQSRHHLTRMTPPPSIHFLLTLSIIGFTGGAGDGSCSGHVTSLSLDTHIRSSMPVYGLWEETEVPGHASLNPV